MAQVNREMLKAIRPEIDAALVAIGIKYGVTLRAGAGKYADSYGSFKLELQDVAGPTPDALRFTSGARWIGIDPDALGRNVTLSGSVFTITGMTSSGRKITLTEATGKVFTCAPETVAKQHPYTEDVTPVPLTIFGTGK